MWKPFIIPDWESLWEEGSGTNSPCSKLDLTPRTLRTHSTSVHASVVRLFWLPPYNTWLDLHYRTKHLPWSNISKVNNLSRLHLAVEGEATPQNTLGSSRTLCGCLCMAVAFPVSPRKEPNVPGPPKLWLWCGDLSFPRTSCYFAARNRPRGLSPLKRSGKENLAS